MRLSEEHICDHVRSALDWTAREVLVQAEATAQQVTARSERWSYAEVRNWLIQYDAQQAAIKPVKPRFDDSREHREERRVDRREDRDADRGEQREFGGDRRREFDRGDRGMRRET